MSYFPDTNLLEILDGLLDAYVAVEVMSGQSQCDSEHCASVLRVINDQFRAYLTLVRTTDALVAASWGSSLSPSPSS